MPTGCHWRVSLLPALKLELMLGSRRIGAAYFVVAAGDEVGDVITVNGLGRGAIGKGLGVFVGAGSAGLAVAVGDEVWVTVGRTRATWVGEVVGVGEDWMGIGTSRAAATGSNGGRAASIC